MLLRSLGIMLNAAELGMASCRCVDGSVLGTVDQVDERCWAVTLIVLAEGLMG